MDKAISKYQTVTPEVFSDLFQCSVNELNEATIDLLKKLDTRYQDSTKVELEEHIHHYLSLLKTDRIVRSLEENIAIWEKGWSENLTALQAGQNPQEAVKPRYFRGNKFLRFKKGLVVSPNLQIEHDLFKVARYYLFYKFLKDFDSIYEIGCGSCQNLLLLSELFPNKSICGLDWVKPPVEIANQLGKTLNRSIRGELFNMMKPPSDFKIKPNSAVITIHAMEQIANQHTAFLETLLKAKPALVLHYEPIYEFYDEKNLLDYLAMWYSEKRKYLIGLWPALIELEKQKRIKIIESKRPGLGGVLHESSLLIWKPL